MEGSPSRCSRSLFEVRSSGGQTGVFTTSQVPAGTPLSVLRGPLQDHPGRHTIQIGESDHLDASGSVDGQMNHSCTPNSFVDLSNPSQPVIRAIHALRAGSELTIDYCASEEVVVEPFECHCESENCYGVVRGYSYLTNRQRLLLRELTSPYLLEKHGDPRQPQPGLLPRAS